jgi:hypothetical protein
MTRKLMLFGALVSLAMSQGMRGEELPSTSASQKRPVLVSRITCNGNLSVPMTADQEQALPLKIIANLECGQEVTVLSDVEGYTVNVVTPDGLNGYVARMYVTRPTVKKAEASAPEESTLTRSGVVRWQVGAKGSSEFQNGDQAVESLTANGITVQVSLHDTGWKYRANIAVANAGSQAVYVLPKLLSLDETAPLLKPLTYEDPAHVAKAMNHQILWTSASAGPASNSRSQSSSSASSAPVTFNVVYKSPVTTSPNYLAQQQAAEDQAARNQAALVDMVREIQALSLRECTLKSGEKTAGAVWFERDAKSRQLVLRLPVGGVIFEFPFSFNDEK